VELQRYVVIASGQVRSKGKLLCCVGSNIYKNLA
jgi:hypothetical protein